MTSRNRKYCHKALYQRRFGDSLEWHEGSECIERNDTVAIMTMMMMMTIAASVNEVADETRHYAKAVAAAGRLQATQQRTPRYRNTANNKAATDTISPPIIKSNSSHASHRASIR